MKGTITKIDQWKWGNGAEFKRVYFDLDNATWAKTDLVRENRNWDRWKDLLEVGNVLENLTLKDERTVNADSRPWLAARPPKQFELF